MFRFRRANEPASAFTQTPGACRVSIFLGQECEVSECFQGVRIEIQKFSIAFGCSPLVPKRVSYETQKVPGFR
jgi:hypothetical protein